MNKAKVIPVWERKEARLLKGSLLRFDKDKQINDLSEIIYNLMKRGNFYDGTKPKTFSVTTNRSSGNYYTRSIEDTFRVAKHYIPNITYKQVQDAMEQLKSTNLLQSHYCCTCGRKVFQPIPYNLTQETITNNLKELNIKVK